MKIILTALVVAILPMLSSPARADGTVWLADPSEGEIVQTIDDGTVATTVMTGLYDPTGLAIDNIGRKVFWSNGTIHRAELASHPDLARALGLGEGA